MQQTLKCLSIKTFKCSDGVLFQAALSFFQPHVSVTVFPNIIRCMKEKISVIKTQIGLISNLCFLA